MKPVILVYGNCQSFAMTAIARTLPTLVDRFQIHYCPCHPTLGDVTLKPELVERCEVVWEQVGVDQRLPFKEGLPATARCIRFPELSFPLLWPLDCIDPRNAPDPPTHWGKFPYGDRLALQLMDVGLYGEAGFAAWVERGPSALRHLSRLLELELARSRRRSADVDLEPMDYIFQHWQDRRLFATINHPSNLVLWPLCMQLVESSLPLLSIPRDEIADAEMRFTQPLPGAVDMDWFQMVIHPFVAETFGLRWAGPELLHRVEVPGIDRKLTRAEFMTEHYMRAPG